METVRTLREGNDRIQVRFQYNIGSFKGYSGRMNARYVFPEIAEALDTSAHLKREPNGRTDWAGRQAGRQTAMHVRAHVRVYAQTHKAKRTGSMKHSRFLLGLRQLHIVSLNLQKLDLGGGAFGPCCHAISISPKHQTEP